MKNSAGLDSEREIFASVVKLLRNLGPFGPDAPREAKWRTTEQLANELKMFGRDAIDHLDRILRQHEAHSLERLEKGLSPQAMLRRAKYPDRTTALPLWGSVEHHGQPWLGHRPDRSDPPDDVPSALIISNTAASVFLSHSSQDADLALRLAEALAGMQIASWRFETHIHQRGNIADCVREAIDETSCLMALVTRQSIASLWVLTELHTALEGGTPAVLVVHTDDGLLLKLIQSVRFSYPDQDFDKSVEYDREVVALLKKDYAAYQNHSRIERYESQVGDFLATLPKYLGYIPSGTTKRIWLAAFAFPNLPSEWSGPIKLISLKELPGRIKGNYPGRFDRKG